MYIISGFSLSYVKKTNKNRVSAQKINELSKINLKSFVLTSFNLSILS